MNQFKYIEQYLNCELPDVQTGFRKGKRNFPNQERSTSRLYTVTLLI